MQKHQQWLDNRNYQHHLQCLTKIKQNSRKNNVKSAIHTRRRRMSNRHMSDDEFYPSIQHAQQQGQQSNSPKAHKNIQITSKQKQLLWNNFLLGKRIVSTNPVINIKQQQDAYKKHRKIVEWRFRRNKKLALNTEFREAKLKEYTQNTCRIANCFRLPTTGRSRNILALRIVKLELCRPKLLQDLIVKMKIQNKKTNQSSDIVNIQNLMDYQFFFKYYCPKDNNSTTQRQNGVQIQIYQMKGLQQRQLGAFTIDRQNIGIHKVCLGTQLRKFGKNVGQVQFQVCINKRSVLKQTL